VGEREEEAKKGEDRGSVRWEGVVLIEKRTDR